MLVFTGLKREINVELFELRQKRHCAYDVIQIYYNNSYKNVYFLYRYESFRHQMFKYIYRSRFNRLQF